MNDYRDVEFVETEFRPHGGRQDPQMEVTTDKDVMVQGGRRKRRTLRLGHMPAEIRTVRHSKESSATAGKHVITAHPATLFDEEGDALNDLERGLSDAEDITGRRVRVREIV